MESIAQFRYFITLQFVGTSYNGWQKQPNGTGIQQLLEDALTVLLKRNTDVTGAGRTDTGVHATNYTAHFDSVVPLEISGRNELIYRLNRILPPDIAVEIIQPVISNAHARYSAISRSYQYYICRKKDPFQIDRAWILERELDIEMMQELASLLLTYNDFKCFSRSNTQVKHYRCQLIESEWKMSDHFLIFHIKADRFLRNMVRAIVGTLVEGGLGKLTINDLASILESRDRSRAGYSAPGCGLYFTGADYSSDIFTE